MALMFTLDPFQLNLFRLGVHRRGPVLRNHVCTAPFEPSRDAFFDLSRLLSRRRQILHYFAGPLSHQGIRVLGYRKGERDLCFRRRLGFAPPDLRLSEHRQDSFCTILQSI